MLTFDQIKELIELVAKRRLQGVEVEKAGFRLKIDGFRVERPPAPGAAEAGAVPAGAAPSDASGSGAEPSPQVAAAESASAASVPQAGPAPGQGAHVLTSPIVGTFYRAPSPDATPYVEVGDRVTKGQVLCIVEAMKLMNEIESDVGGVVVEIYPKNAQPVEFGEPLFAIRVS